MPLRPYFLSIKQKMSNNAELEGATENTWPKNNTGAWQTGWETDIWTSAGVLKHFEKCHGHQKFLENYNAFNFTS